MPHRHMYVTRQPGMKKRKRKQQHGRQQDQLKEGEWDRNRRNKQRHYKKTRGIQTPRSPLAEARLPRGKRGAQERQAPQLPLRVLLHPGQGRQRPGRHYRQAQTSSGRGLSASRSCTGGWHQEERQTEKTTEELNEKDQRDGRKRMDRVTTRTSLTMWCREPGR